MTTQHRGVTPINGTEGWTVPRNGTVTSSGDTEFHARSEHILISGIKTTLLLNKTSWTADKGWSYSLGVGRGANNSWRQRKSVLRNVRQDLKEI